MLRSPIARGTILQCDRDPGDLTPAAAHRAMQAHLECTVDTCRPRRRARAVLVQARRMVLDERAVRDPEPAA